MILSVCVISHNQREELKRCLDSLLAQSISFDYEILVSDDASDDGSFELAKEYEQRYPVVKAYTVCSDDYNPSNKSFRSGINRCNALKHATGKYIAHIDGDDFLIADSKIYEKQVELLERYKECSCCMANDYTLKEGEDVSAIQIRHLEAFKTGYVLKKEDYISNYFRESHYFVYRRNLDMNPIDQLGGYYVDNSITAFYLQSGDIVCIDDAGYVYVQYKTSVWNDYKKTSDYLIIGCPALFNAALIPMWKPVYLNSPWHLARIQNVVTSAMRGDKITEATLKWMSKFDYYIFHIFNKKLSWKDKVHLETIRILVIVMKRLKRRCPRVSLPWRLLNAIL